MLFTFQSINKYSCFLYNLKKKKFFKKTLKNLIFINEELFIFDDLDVLQTWMVM